VPSEDLIYPIIVPSYVKQVDVRDDGDTPLCNLVCKFGIAADVQDQYPIGGKIDEVIEGLACVHHTVRFTEAAEHRHVVPFHVDTELVLHIAFSHLLQQLGCLVYWRRSLRYQQVVQWWVDGHVTPTYVQSDAAFPFLEAKASEDVFHPFPRALAHVVTRIPRPIVQYYPALFVQFP
jgi:hypothetical protein